MDRAAGLGDIGLGGIDLDRGDAGDAAIGVDVGGTKTAIGLIDAATRTLLAKTVIPTGRERGGEAILRDVEEKVRSLDGHARSLGQRVAGVGVVVPENVSLAGRITSSAVMPGWNELPVAERLGAVAPTVIDSDVRAAALAEARLGAGRDYRFHAFMTISTGISYCAVIDGRPFADVLDSGARALGLGIALLLNVLDPEAVVTGGGLGGADTEYWSRARRWARHYAHDHAKPTPVIRGGT